MFKKKWQELWLSNIFLQAWHQIQKKTMYRRGAGCVRRRAARTRKWTQKKTKIWLRNSKKKRKEKVMKKSKKGELLCDEAVPAANQPFSHQTTCTYMMTGTVSLRVIYTNFTSRRELCAFSHRCVDQLVPVAGHFSFFLFSTLVTDVSIPRMQFAFMLHPQSFILIGWQGSTMKQSLSVCLWWKLDVAVSLNNNNSNNNTD